jgi:hypothetical protein
LTGARQPRHDGSDGDLQRVRQLAIGQIVEFAEHEQSLKPIRVRLIVLVATKASTPADARDRLVARFRERAAIRVPERVATWSAKLGCTRRLS